MATSRITSFRQALLRALQSREALNNMQIAFGMPSTGLSREHILIGEVTATQEYRTIGGASGLKYENFDQVLYVGVLREGVQQQDADERAIAILAEIESAIRTDPSVSETVLVAQITEYRLDPVAGEQSRLALMTLTIQAQARI